MHQLPRTTRRRIIRFIRHRGHIIRPKVELAGNRIPVGRSYEVLYRCAIWLDHVLLPINRRSSAATGLHIEMVLFVIIAKRNAEFGSDADDEIGANIP